MILISCQSADVTLWQQGLSADIITLLLGSLTKLIPKKM
jgi:hypothetical protein